MEKNELGVLWIRESTEDQKFGYNPLSQLKKCRKYAEEKHIVIPEGGEFNIDETGYKEKKRKKFNRMMEFLGTNKIKHLIVFAIDRAGRNVPDGVKIYYWATKPEHYFHSVNEDLVLWEKSKPMVKKAFHQAFVDAEFESAKNADRTIEGMTQKCELKGYPSLAPVGYENVADLKYINTDEKYKKRTIVKDVGRAPLIVKAFELYATGKFSLSSLREEITKMGLTTRKTKKRPVRPISMHGLEVILKNVFYTGMQRWSGVLWQGSHEPLISNVLYEDVQKMLAEKARSENAGRRPSTDFPLRPFLECGKCGCKITAGWSKGKYPYYFCTKMKGACDQKIYKPEDLDRLIMNEVENIRLSKKTIEVVKQQLEKINVNQEGGEKKKIKELKMKITQEKGKLAQLYSDRLNNPDLVTMEMYKEHSEKVQKTVTFYEREMSKLGKVNLECKSQGIAIIELLSKFKENYARQDLPGKVKILEIILKKMVVENGKATFIWREPFNMFFQMTKMIESQKVQRKELRGE